MIYLIIIIGLTLLGIYSKNKETKIISFIKDGVEGFMVGMLISLILLLCVGLSYDGEIETVILETDNQNVVKVERRFTDKGFCNMWLLGITEVESELLYVNNKGGE